VRRGHTLPTGEGAKARGEGQRQDGREFRRSASMVAISLLRDLFSAAHAASALFTARPGGDPFAGGIAELVRTNGRSERSSLRMR